MGMGAGQAAALAPDLGRAKPAMQSIFALIDRVGGVSFFISSAVKFCIFGICEMRAQVPHIYGGSLIGKQPEEIKVR